MSSFSEVLPAWPLPIDEGAGCTYDILIGHIKPHVEMAKITIEFFSQMLIGGPSELAVIYTNAWIPVHAIILFGTPVGEHLHTPAHTSFIKIGLKINTEGHVSPRTNGFGKIHPQDGIFLLHTDLFLCLVPVNCDDADSTDLSAKALLFILTICRAIVIGFVQLIKV